MRKLLSNILIFALFFLTVAELTIRLFHLSTDAPRTYENSNGKVNYYPNQEGYWDGGKHKWFVNEMGYPGKNLPSSNENLVLLIGDSYIQNFMNPDSCRQKSYLDGMSLDYNLLEVSMAGLNFLGYLEYSKPLDSLNPIHKIVYVGTKDFQSIILGERRSGEYQLDLSANQILYPEYRGSKWKDLIYNFKYIYYLYRKNLDWFQTGKNQKMKRSNQDAFLFDKNEIDKTITFVKKNYDLSNISFVFHPNTSLELVEYLKKRGLNVFHLTKDGEETWSTREDGHWSCYGHQQVALQVASVLRTQIPLVNDTKNEY